MGIVNVLEDTNALNDPNAGNHVRRLAAYSEHGARSFGCKEDFIQVMCRFAGLHDIGKVGLPDALKWKVHTFDENEREQMKEHVTLGHRLLKRATMPLPAQNIALFHHERADGSGYPLGLVGEIIPFEASVVSIADVFDALTTDKPWRSPNHYSFTEAIEIMTGHLRPAFHGSLLKHFFADVKALEAIRERFPDPGI
jgi:HD-GYP domain-containing protein (c-di-GMP phosphodiesterase class II)